MKYLRHILGMGLCFLGSITLGAQTPQQLFEMGNEHYATARYQEAIDTYKRILDTGQESAAVYFNLANAHYKLNNIAPSIYYYEKAKQLDPTDRDIATNATFAEQMRIDAITPLPQHTFKKWYNQGLSLLTTDGWAYVTVIAAIAMVFLFLGYYFSYHPRRKRLLFTGSIVALGIAILSTMFAFSAFAKAETDRPAIVFAAETQVKSEPNMASAQAFVLHEGTKVSILDTVKNWTRIQLADGKTGWMPEVDLREL